MLRLHILYEHSGDSRPYCSSHIRLLRPLNHPSNAGAFNLSWAGDYQPADVVVLERSCAPHKTLRFAEETVKQYRADKACLIYSIDDNLLDRDADDTADKEELMVVRYLAREADGVIVSTEHLRNRFARFNRNTIVVPNALDDTLISSSSRTSNSKHKVIGYMGTYTHHKDIMMIAQALREVLRKNPNNLRLEFVGGVHETTLDVFADLPVRRLDIKGNGEYPVFVPWMNENIRWDLAIAPLEDNSFTRCKSDIKFLDYSALGIAGVYSRVAAYEHTVRHLETGYLADNNTEDWVEGLERVLADDSLRRRLAEQAREYVLSSRTLKHCAQNWHDAILAIVESAGGSADDGDADLTVKRMGGGK